MSVDYAIAARVLLGIITLLIALGIFDVWRSTRAPQFVVGLLLIYYFSLAGAWKVIGLPESGEPDPSVDHLEASLFPLDVDANYLLTIGLYGVFILALVIALRFTAFSPAHARSKNAPKAAPLEISHSLILLMSLCAFAASSVLIWDAISSSLETGVSAYSLSRHESNPFITIHQLLNRVGIDALAIGLAIAAARRPRSPVLFAYLPLATLWLAFLAVLGNRNELLVAIIAGAFIFYSLGGRVGKGWLFTMGIVGFVVLRLIEYLRSMGVEALSAGIGDVLARPDFWNPLALASGSESVAAHMSLYGVVGRDIDLTYGSSVLYLVNSLIPRNLLADRVADSYSIYASAVSAPDDQGFTIHFAAGCYLNFGIAGIIMGAIALALIWTAVYRAMWARRGSSSQLPLAAIVAFCFCSAFVPVAMRNGPEGLKGLFIEGILLPYLISRFVVGGFFRKKESGTSCVG